MSEVKKISYSEFKTWKECPYRHKLIYIDNEPYYSGNEYTAFGSAIHAACENLKHSSEKSMIDIFNNAFNEELNILEDQKTSINNTLVEQMRNQAVAICNQVIPAVNKYFKNFSIVSIEEQILEPIDEFDSFGKKFKGFIDMVLKTEDGKYHIIDWKTCSWGWDAKKKSDPIINYQLTFYKNYFSKKHNIDASNVNTYFVLLKRTAKKDNVEIVKVTSGKKKTTNGLKILQNAVINIERGNYIKNRLNCKYCKFHKTEYCK